MNHLNDVRDLLRHLGGANANGAGPSDPAPLLLFLGPVSVAVTIGSPPRRPRAEPPHDDR